MEENNWYIYRHLKPNGEVFYIGIGKTKNFKRAYSKGNRNKHWHRLTAKYGYEVQILKKGMSLDHANELEMTLISYHKRRDVFKEGTLVNLTDGGNAVKGLIFTKEHRDKISKANTGNRGMVGAENHRFGKTGVLNHLYGIPLSEDRKKNHSLAMRGRFSGEKNPMHGKKGENAPASKRIGNKHPLFGTKLSEETKDKKRQTMLKNGRNKGVLNGHAKTVKNTVTLEEVGTAKELSQILNLSYDIIKKMLTGKQKNKTDWVYKENYIK